MTSNTVILKFRDPSVFSSALGAQTVKEGIIALILDAKLLCSSDANDPEKEIQCIRIPSNLNQSPLRVSVTMYDVRNAQTILNHCTSPVVRAEYAIEEVILDASGSNRSVVIPRSSSFSLDSLFLRFSAFGEIEKIWFTDESSLTIDFLDARAPMRVREFIDNIPAIHEPNSFPNNDQLNGILTGIY